MKNFVARSLHFVARCTPYTVATCNKREFPGGLTYETPLLHPCNERPQKRASRCRLERLFLQPLQHLLQRVFGVLRQPFSPLRTSNHDRPAAVGIVHRRLRLITNETETGR